LAGVLASIKAIVETLRAPVPNSGAAQAPGDHEDSL